VPLGQRTRPFGAGIRQGRLRIEEFHYIRDAMNVPTLGTL
jgi:hypothetical protein